jgi:hypothetical protein
MEALLGAFAPVAQIPHRLDDAERDKPLSA